MQCKDTPFFGPICHSACLGGIRCSSFLLHVVVEFVFVEREAEAEKFPACGPMCAELHGCGDSNVPLENTQENPFPGSINYKFYFQHEFKSS